MKRLVKIRTKNFTARPLRGTISTDKRAIVRLGSLTPTGKIFPTVRDIIEINTVEAIENSRNKLRMKECFAKLDVPQAEWWSNPHDFNLSEEIDFPLVLKRVYGFQGHGMRLLNNKDELVECLKKHDIGGSWFIEKFYNYSREYRLHVAKGIGIFMSWRKLRTKEATDRWFFNSHNSNWVGVDHELFNKPTCWKAMETAAINSLEATGLDLGAVDIRVQSNKQENPHFIVCEINSAPSLGTLGIEKYKEIITNLINNNNG